MFFGVADTISSLSFSLGRFCARTDARGEKRNTAKKNPQIGGATGENWAKKKEKGWKWIRERERGMERENAENE